MSLIKHRTIGISRVETIYHVGVSFGEPEEGISFEVTYVHHNGYTMIKAITGQKYYRGFGQWFNDYNTRWSQNWHKRRFGRKVRVLILAFEKIEQAYAAYLLENQAEQSQGNDTEVRAKDKPNRELAPR